MSPWMKKVKNELLTRIIVNKMSTRRHINLKKNDRLITQAGAITKQKNNIQVVEIFLNSG